MKSFKQLCQCAIWHLSKLGSLKTGKTSNFWICLRKIKSMWYFLSAIYSKDIDNTSQKKESTSPHNTLLAKLLVSFLQWNIYILTKFLQNLVVLESRLLLVHFESKWICCVRIDGPLKVRQDMKNTPFPSKTMKLTKSWNFQTVNVHVVVDYFWRKRFQKKLEIMT